MFRIFLALATVSLALASDPDKVVPAINDIESWQQVGQQPYEMTWTERAENPHTLVDFEDLSGWKLELYGGAAGEFRRSREQQMWGHSVGKFVFSGPTTESRVVARPPQPIADSRGVRLGGAVGLREPVGLGRGQNDAGGGRRGAADGRARQGVSHPADGHPLEAVVADPPPGQRRRC
jgi:hypothetical protein